MEAKKTDQVVGKKLYGYQQKAIEKLFAKMEERTDDWNLLYQLPTGGGKTVIFSEITRRYIAEKKKKVLILTHRIELLGQTSKMLDVFGVKNKIINSEVKSLEDQDQYQCFVAMVETLNNRLKDDQLWINDIGMVIIDEAHYNSFRKLFKHFESSFMLGVTATPLSSNIKLPMKDHYDELLVGESISDLIKNGYLSKATTYSYDVRLSSLKVGINGDYTVSSSERLYTNTLMQGKLLYAYEEVSLGKKTLIFNNGINTSLMVEAIFKKAGYEIRHLDHSLGAKERKEILEWFKNTPDAILTSVSILTTGFDEPSVETIILNRATKSLTLYHQMIGRGSRALPNKKEFKVIDLGNNARRFGLWEDYVDWQHIFKAPFLYYENLQDDLAMEREFVYEMPEKTRQRFSNTRDISFDVRAAYKKALQNKERPRVVLDQSLEQHAKICLDNSSEKSEALELLKLLDEDIESRIKSYSYCICKSTNSYLRWLSDDYRRKLKQKIVKAYW